MNNKKKLTLNKERVASLSNDQMNNVQGGKELLLDDGHRKSSPSTQNGFTCCWCSMGASAPKNCPVVNP